VEESGSLLRHFEGHPYTTHGTSCHRYYEHHQLHYNLPLFVQKRVGMSCVLSIVKTGEKYE
jgi:hypothetical protein